VKYPSHRRVAIVALLLAPVLAACGFNAQTDQVYQAGTGVNDRSGDVYVLNALIVSGEDGSGTFVAGLDNERQSKSDRLTGITGDGVSVKNADDIEVPPNALVNLAEDGKVWVTGDGVVPGKFVTLTLTFASGQSTTVRVPVETHQGDYADVPLPRSKPTATGTPSAE